MVPLKLNHHTLAVIFFAAVLSSMAQATEFADKMDVANIPSGTVFQILSQIPVNSENEEGLLSADIQHGKVRSRSEIDPSIPSCRFFPGSSEILSEVLKDSRNQVRMSLSSSLPSYVEKTETAIEFRFNDPELGKLICTRPWDFGKPRQFSLSMLREIFGPLVRIRKVESDPGRRSLSSMGRPIGISDDMDARNLPQGATLRIEKNIPLTMADSRWVHVNFQLGKVISDQEVDKDRPSCRLDLVPRASHPSQLRADLDPNKKINLIDTDAYSVEGSETAIQFYFMDSEISKLTCFHSLKDGEAHAHFNVNEIRHAMGEFLKFDEKQELVN